MFVLSLGSLPVFVRAAAAGDEPVSLDAILQPIADRAKIPGLAAAVLHGGQIVAEGVSGVRRKNSPEPITRADQFELCSATKPMTATLVALLVEEGKLNWDTRLADIFAEPAATIDPAWKQATVRQLLAQRAGISGMHPLAFLESVGSAKDVMRQRRAFALKLLSHRPDFVPGSRFVYSAANFIVAGAIVEKVTGRAWEDALREKIWAPLGIANGGFGPPGRPGTVDQPWGHGHPRLFQVPLPGWSATSFAPTSRAADFPAASWPAGGAHLNLADWARFIALHLRADPSNPHRQTALLHEETFALLHQLTPGESDYAGGWFVGTRPWANGGRTNDSGRVFFHAGDNGRWSTVVWVAPERDFAMLIACNRGGMAAPLDEVAGALLRFLPQTAPGSG